MWVILCEHVTAQGTRAATVLDMFVHESNASITEAAAEQAEMVAHQTAIHQNFFTLMSMSSPVVSILTFPAMTTTTGKRLLKDAVNQLVTTPIADIDFDVLFENALSRR